MPRQIGVIILAPLNNDNNDDNTNNINNDGSNKSISGVLTRAGKGTGDQARI